MQIVLEQCPERVGAQIPVCGATDADHRAKHCERCLNIYRDRRKKKKERRCGSTDPRHRARTCSACNRIGERQRYRSRRQERLAAGWRPADLRAGLCGRADPEHTARQCHPCHAIHQRHYKGRAAARRNQVSIQPTVFPMNPIPSASPAIFDENAAIERLDAAFDRFEQVMTNIFERTPSPATRDPETEPRAIDDWS